MVKRILIVLILVFSCSVGWGQEPAIVDLQKEVDTLRKMIVLQSVLELQPIPDADYWALMSKYQILELNYSRLLNRVKDIEASLKGFSHLPTN